MFRNPCSVAALAALVAFTAACPEYYDPDAARPSRNGMVGGSSSSGSAGGSGSGSISFTIYKDRLSPQSRSTKAGGSVVMQNRASEPHAIDAECSEMDTRGVKINPGEDRTLRAPSTGSCRFWLQDQPSSTEHQGTVSVQ